ncbi:hypothetical protein DV515_00011340 [Chloebia gouldiae]|uniref:Uncharacterized protein n=1 Tax=Chloebia gouldiae TaxID=44316 RepID=A0A3L8S7J5_CHLGU|nr:hypothetical protein DV515_00011340 [Chloebia gouldiae]
MIKSSWFYVKFKHAEKIREQRRARAAGCGSNFSTVQVSVSQFTVRVRPYGVYLDEQKGQFPLKCLQQQGAGTRG